MIEHDGKLYARVSNVIQPFTNFGHIDPKVLANKAKIGTSVHEAIKDDLDGCFPIPCTTGLGYFQSYCKWKEHLNPKVVQSEVRYFCDKKMITGQIDCLIEIPNSMQLPVLVDFKTSHSESREVWKMQSHLYNYLLIENGIDVCPRFIFLKLDKNGKMPEVFQYAYDNEIHKKCMKAVEEFWKKTPKDNFLSITS